MQEDSKDSVLWYGRTWRKNIVWTYSYLIVCKYGTIQIKKKNNENMNR